MNLFKQNSYLVIITPIQSGYKLCVPLIKCCRWRVPLLLPSDDCGEAINQKTELSYILQTVSDDRYWKKSPLQLLQYRLCPTQFISLFPKKLFPCAAPCKHFLWLTLYWMEIINFWTLNVFNELKLYNWLWRQLQKRSLSVFSQCSRSIKLH